MPKEHYLYSKRYLVNSKDKLVLPIAFLSGYEAFQYGKRNNLSKYQVVVSGGDVRRFLGQGYKEAFQDLPTGATTNGSKAVPQTQPFKEYSPKPAWQMTREEYYESVTLPEGWKAKGYKPIIRMRKDKRTYIEKVITPDGETLYPMDPIYDTWSRAKYKDDHLMKVKAALEKGLPVPQEVLADYPEMHSPRKLRKYTVPLVGPKFDLGQIVMTSGVAEQVATDTAFAQFVTSSLKRHANGDWGEMSAEDKKENDYSLDKHLRLFSAYEKKPFPKLWLITEADRSATTILFREEY